MESGNSYWDDLRCQTSTAFCTTRVDHFTAITGGHAGTKTMGTGTLQITGLKSSFHVDHRLGNYRLFPDWREQEKSFEKRRIEYFVNKLPVNTSVSWKTTTEAWGDFGQIGLKSRDNCKISLWITPPKQSRLTPTLIKSAQPSAVGQLIR